MRKWDDKYQEEYIWVRASEMRSVVQVKYTNIVLDSVI